MLRAARVIGFLLERSFSISSMVWWTRFFKLLSGLISLNATIGTGMPPVCCLFRQLESYRDGRCPPCYGVPCGCHKEQRLVRSPCGPIPLTRAASLLSTSLTCPARGVVSRASAHLPCNALLRSSWVLGDSDATGRRCDTGAMHNVKRVTEGGVICKLRSECYLGRVMLKVQT